VKGGRMSDVILEMDEVCKSYRLGPRRIDVLRGVSMALRRGETVSVTGASGAGKSTLLHVAGGLDAPGAGAVRYVGRDLYRLGAGARARYRSESVGFIFQSYCLLPELTVLENVLLPCMARPGWFRAARADRRRAADLLERTGLAERADHRPAELSGGEQQRAAIARALVNEPALILADEPTGNLDSRTGGRVLDLLFELVESRGLAVLMATHDGEVAARCHRVARLADGILCD